MLNLKKTEIILGIFLLLLISGVFIIKFPSFIAKATQQEVSVSITIIGSSEEELTVPASGEIEPTDVVIRKTLPKIKGFTNHENDKVKVRVYTSTTPAGFTAPSSTVVETVFNYINITLDTTLTNTAVIYFNLSQSALGSTDSNDVRLYRYDSDWTELTTTVEDSANDPVSFSATTTSFSGFLIGEKGAGVSAPSVPAVSKGGSYVGIPTPKLEKIPKPKLPIIPEKITKVVTERVEKIAEAVVEKPTKTEILLYAILPLIIIGLTILSLFYYLVKQVLQRKLTFYALLLLLGIIILSIIVTSDIFLWAVLPMGIIIILIFVFYTLVLEKTFKRLMKINLKKTIKAFSTKTFVFLFLLAFIVSLILLARFSFTGYTIISDSVKDSFGFIIASIAIILGMGIYYIKKIMNM